MKKAILAAVTAVGIGVALAPAANAAQGGWDHNSNPPHAWLKIGNAEMKQAGGYPQANCFQAVGHNAGAGENQYIACDSLVAGVSAEYRAHPHAAGYWADWYTNGQGHSGTW